MMPPAVTLFDLERNLPVARKLLIACERQPCTSVCMRVWCQPIQICVTLLTFVFFWAVVAVFSSLHANAKSINSTPFVRSLWIEYDVRLAASFLSGFLFIYLAFCSLACSRACCLRTSLSNSLYADLLPSSLSYRSLTRYSSSSDVVIDCRLDSVVAADNNCFRTVIVRTVVQLARGLSLRFIIFRREIHFIGIFVAADLSRNEACCITRRNFHHE